jgi:hypothetical protein
MSPARPHVMRAVIAAVAAVYVTLAAVVVLVIGEAVVSGRHVAAAASNSSAAPCVAPAPTTAAGYAHAMNALPQAGDATLSVRLRDGRVAWIFADSFTATGFVHSTVVMQRGGCFAPSGQQLLPNEGATFWWPMAAAALPDGSVLVTATDGFGGHARAAVLSSDARFVRWLPYWPQGTQGLHWYAGLLVDGATLRVYGTRSTGAPYVVGRELWTASVPLAGLASGAGWQFGSRPVVAASPAGVDDTVAAYRDATGYHVVSLRNGVFGDGAVVSLDSASPSGPFTRHVLFAYNRPGQLRYNVAVHPEAALSDGRLLVTVNNCWPFGDTTIHAWSTYQPSFFAAGGS